MSNIPTWLKHKPIIYVDYADIDSRSGAGDAEYLSLGKAQWNNEDISAKIFRWTGERWSRQSEEMPLWRVLDLATLIISAITGNSSSLNQNKRDKDSIDFLNNYLSENSELYSNRLLELKNLLNQGFDNLSKNSKKDNKPNIFSFATSELSQDSVLAWMINWADDQYKNENHPMHCLGKELLSILTGLEKEQIHNVKVGRQWNNIDIWVEINEDSFLAIEDKTNSTIHDNQLERYKKIVETEYEGKRNNLMFSYVKTHNEPKSTLQLIQNIGYKTITRSDLLAVLDKFFGNNAIVLDFKNHLQNIEDQTNSFKYKPVDEWGTYEWQGFYQELEKYLDIDSWGYVDNPAGGFWGMWWHWMQNDEIRMYLQFEEKKLCIKIEYTGIENRSEIRQKYHNLLITNSKELNLPVIRPLRFGAGTYMTIGVVDTDYIFDSDIINIKIIVNKLKKLSNLINRCV